MKSYKKIFVDEDIRKKDYESKEKSFYREINESTPPKNGINEGRYKYSYESLGMKKEN